MKPASSPSSSKTSGSYAGILKPPANTHSSYSSSGTGILKSPGTSAVSNRVSSGTLKTSGSSSGLPFPANKVTETLQNAWNVPRRDAISGFSGIYTPNSSGLIKSYNGGKLGKDGIVRYPNGVNVDKAHAARSQAFFDVAYGDSTSGRSDMAALYGDDYTNEVRRLANMKTGDLSWAELPASALTSLSFLLAVFLAVMITFLLITAPLICLLPAEILLAAIWTASFPAWDRMRMVMTTVI